MYVCIIILLTTARKYVILCLCVRWRDRRMELRLKRLALLLISPPEYIYYMILAFPPTRHDIQIFTAICFVLEPVA